MARTHSGLTLAELLVVMTIVSGLGGALVPAIGAARRAAVRVACASSLRQVGMCALAYSGDWDGFLPAEGNCGILVAERSPAWFDRLPEYVDDRRTDPRSVFQCAGFRWNDPGLMPNALPRSVKMNAYLDEGGRPRHYRLGRAGGGAESEVALFTDAVGGSCGMGQWGHCLASAVDDSRHPGAVNVLCLDGHTLAQVRTPATKAGWRSAIRWLPNGWTGGP